MATQQSSYVDAQGVTHYTATAAAPVSNPNANYFANPTTTTTPAATATTPASTVQNMSYGQQNTTPTTTINVNAGQTTPQTQTTQTQTQQTQPLTYDPAKNPSVVDLLTSAGQDSSFSARQQLASGLGISNYTGTATQNIELARKFTEAYNAQKGTAVPQSQAEASSILDQYFTGKETAQDPTKQFMDAFSSMNPIEASLFQQLSTLLATPNNQQSLVEFYQQEIAAQGIEGLNMELADINNIIDGTEDDIRSEISKVNGFATDSQVAAMAGARNKTLLKRANYLSDVISAKNDYVDRIVSLTQADRKQVSEDLDRKLGITETLFTMSQSMTNAARENVKMIVDSVGWEGLAQSLEGNPAAVAQVEQLFGMASGELQALASYKKPLSEMETLELENQRLQNKKLTQDIAGSGTPTLSTQVVDLGNGKKILINSKTGETITEFSGNVTDNTLKLANTQQQVGNVATLLNDPNLSSAVGPNPAARLSFTNVFTGGKNNFVAGIEQLRSQLNLDTLIQAKGQGATFGALSDQELRVLANAATKMGTWAVKDKAGNVVGYAASEEDFKKELDKINNFTKLDFILKGGDPASVGVQEAPDGTLWSKNNDGTYTQIM